MVKYDEIGWGGECWENLCLILLIKFIKEILRAAAETEKRNISGSTVYSVALCSPCLLPVISKTIS